MLGFLNINKPSAMTAHDVVSQTRKIFDTKHVGHGGTLDPLATGVLPVAIGKACRLLRYLNGKKTYLAEILLGVTTTTDDIEGEIVASSNVIPEVSQIIKAIDLFTGHIMQMPPAFSAVHYKGERLYNLARQGIVPTDVIARGVVVHSFTVIDFVNPVIVARIECEAGTYIRALARDLGQTLGCGGCLKSLVREQAGPFQINDSLELAKLKELKNKGQESTALIHPAQILNLPCLNLPAEQIQLLINGQVLSAVTNNELSFNPDHKYPLIANHVVLMHEGKIMAICRQTKENLLKPEVVLTNVV